MKVAALLSQMTLAEKASLCSGADFWHLKGIERLAIPSIRVADGPHGLRVAAGSDGQLDIGRSLPATCFPTASALASTWNRELVFAVGAALAEECLEQGVSVILGPGANIKRSPLCGRNFEYFSEDPYLSGELAGSQILGIQSKGIGASLKHFAVNNQEFRRMSIDAIVDQRALHEIYLAGFERAIRIANPWTVMGAYNRLNGEYCCESTWLMQEVLRQDWGYQGVVISDWGAIDDRIAALIAGTDLEMPGLPNGSDERIVAAQRGAELPLEVLDRSAARILALIVKSPAARSAGGSFDRPAHHALAYQAAAESITLLKNDDALLPLATGKPLAVIGEFARHPRYQGAGSSLVNPWRLENALEMISELTGREQIEFAAGYPREGEAIDNALLNEAVELARRAETVVIFAGLSDVYEVEGLDRQHLHLPAAHDALIEAVAAVNPRLVVVLSNGSAVEMPWIARVPAVLEAHLAGQAGAGAIAEILFGRLNPSGKLAETFPLALSDTPCFQYFPGGPRTVEYRESIFVGYRHYDRAQLDVLFPFGHGLSYTTFEYGPLTLSRQRIMPGEGLQVRLQLSNSGKRPGKEIVQLYLRPIQSSLFRPEKELKGFAKIDLRPAEQQWVEFELDGRAFAAYSPEIHDWYIEPGRYEILVGASSRDIRCRAMLEIAGEPSPQVPDRRAELPAYYEYQAGRTIDAEEFEKLLGRPLPGNRPEQWLSVNTPIGDMQHRLLGRLLGAFLRRRVRKIVAGLEHTPTALLVEGMAEHAPLRLLMMASEGAISYATLEAICAVINGHYLQGLRRLWAARQSPAVPER